MGYAHYEFDDGAGPRGYGVEDTCHEPGCDKRIDRGMAYLCYRCTGYFCGEHLYMGHGRKFSCFAGEVAQACGACLDEPQDDGDAA